MNPFIEWLTEVEDDPIVIKVMESGLNTEAQSNLWTFALSQQQAQELDAEEVIQFLANVVLARERQVIKQFGQQHPMIFYCWFDEQAIQLRFSLVSSFHNSLPFGEKVILTDDLAGIVEQFLGK